MAAEWPRALLQCKCSVGNMQCFDSNPAWRGPMRFMCISGPEELDATQSPCAVCANQVIFALCGLEAP